MNVLPVIRSSDSHTYSFTLHPDVSAPEEHKTVFIILLDGDLVMSPEHLGVALMAAVLRRAGFRALILEVPHGGLEEAVRRVEREAPQLVCFTLMSLNVQSCFALAAAVRAALPGVPIACGGPAGTYSGAQLFEASPHIDIVAVGEGEPTIFELVQALYLNRPLSTCPGIMYRDADGKVTTNALRPLMHNLDDLPFPARDQFEQHGNDLEYMRVSTSRGCVARCTFCSAPHAGNRVQKGRAWRGRSVDSVLRELEELVGKYKYRTYDFIDSTFEDPDGGRIGKTRVAEIARGILERGLDIYFNCCMRAENWSDDDHELLELLVLAGLEKVNVGIESGTTSELELWEKRATVDDNVRIIRLLREHGIYLAMGFIQFHPYSTVDTLRSNAEFLRRNAGHNLRRLTERLEIYPGTPLIGRLEDEGLLGEDYWKTFDHYDYRYKDERVARLAVHFASLYNNDDYHERGIITEQSAVFRFETFNVVVSTFWSRLYRRFHHIDGAKATLDGFKGELDRIRRELAEFNYEFFTSNLEDVLADRLDVHKHRRQVADVERVFGSKMEEIRTLQLRVGRQLSRLGADVRRISSVLEPEPRLTRTYTGGGTACW